MNVDSILISEYASTTESGRLTVVNTFDTVQVTEMPAKVPSFFISVVTEGHRSERGTTHEIHVKLLDSQRNEIGAEQNTAKELVFPDTEPAPGMFLRHISIFKLGVQFPAEGPYSFEVHIDGTYHAAANLYVQVVEQAS